MNGVVAVVLLVVGLACCWVSLIGVLVTHGVYDRLHFLGPVGMGAVCIAVAVFVREPFTATSTKAVFSILFVVVTSPIVVHATARAARIAEHGSWQARADEADSEDVT